MRDLGLLALRLTVGGLLAGHGAQKLFGWFGGYGPEGTAGFMESLGLRPGKPWALAAGASELGGGALTALGLLSPLGPISMLAPMATATGTAHRGKPIWATEGGAELPVVNMAAAAALTLTGPGRLSLDRALGIRVPPALALLALAGVVAGVAMNLNQAASAARDAGNDAPAGDATPEAIEGETIGRDGGTEATATEASMQLLEPSGAAAR